MNKPRMSAIATALAGTLGLGGCASDPAFWNNLAYGLDTLAYELDNVPICRWDPDGYGGLVQTCAPAWAANRPDPDYINPLYDPRLKRRDRHDHYDHAGKRDRRDEDRPRRGKGD